MGASAYQPEGFFRKKVEPCEDCLLRDDLDILGRPRLERRGRIAECDGCKGTGTQARSTSADPYFTGRGV